MANNQGRGNGPPEDRGGGPPEDRGGGPPEDRGGGPPTHAGPPDHVDLPEQALRNVPEHVKQDMFRATRGIDGSRLKHVQVETIDGESDADSGGGS